MNEIEISKEYKEIQEKILSLSKEYASLIEEEDNLIRHEKPVLLIKYGLEIGQYVLQYLQKNLEFMQLRRKIELMQASINRGENVDMGAIEEKLQVEFKAWIEQISTLNQEISYAKSASLIAVDENISREIKILYKKLVRRLHPDLNKNLTEREKLLWNRLTLAYESFDLEAMKNIEILLDSEEPVKENSSLEEMRSRYEKLWEKVLQAQEKLKTIRMSFPFSIGKQLLDSNWVTREVSTYTEKILEIEKAMPDYIKIYQNILYQLYGKISEHPENL
jgi:hypothetical protein